jgi:hypothetical protein
MEPINLIIVVLVGLFSSFFGTVSGGGSLIILPVLIFLGLPVQAAIGTTRFSGFGAGIAGLYKFGKGGKVLYKTALPLIVFATAGSFVGANIVLRIEESILQKMVAILLLSTALMLIFKKEVGVEKTIVQLSKKRKVLGYMLSFFIGIGAGFFGVGILFGYLLIFLFGMTFLESAGTRKLLGIPPSIIPVLIYVFSGNVVFLYAGILFICRAIGSYFGAGFALKHGEGYAKFIFIIIALIFSIKLLI